MGERPLDSFQVQTAGDRGIFIHVQVVVVVDKLVPQRLAENRPDVIAARKMQTPGTVQRSFKPAARLSDFSERESSTPGISPAGEAGGIECTAAAFFFDLPLMKRAKGVPRIDGFSSGNGIM